MTRIDMRRVRKLALTHSRQARAYLVAVLELDKDHRAWTDTAPRDHLARLAQIHTYAAARLAHVVRPDLLED